MAKYKIVTLCGSTRFRKEFEEVQKKLTLDGFIVISLGLFGHSDDNEVWENMSEGELTETKIMLDDMHKSKIDMAEAIYVVNPGGYIGSRTWSEICYAYMTDKKIMSLVPIDSHLIIIKARAHIAMAEELAWQQQDVVIHLNADYQGGYPTDQMIQFKHKNRNVLDPWMTDEEDVPIIKIPYYGHGDSTKGFDPFKRYGAKKVGKFVEEIVVKCDESELRKEEERQEKLIEAEEYADMMARIGITPSYPDHYPYSSFEELDDFNFCWSEFRG